jgi:nicotinamidase-related amidase
LHLGLVYTRLPAEYWTMSRMSRTENRLPEPFTPENTTILMVDYSIGFANIFRSHTFNDNNRAAVALAKTALGFDTGFVFNLGAGQHPYPDLVRALGDHPIIYRGGEYSALDNPKVAEAVRKTARSHLAIAGITTEGCVLYTALGAVRQGYTVAIVEDATAGETREAHEMAIQRMIQAGIIPTTVVSFATELQNDWANAKTAQAYFSMIAEAEPALKLGIDAEHANAK